MNLWGFVCAMQCATIISAAKALRILHASVLAHLASLKQKPTLCLQYPSCEHIQSTMVQAGEHLSEQSSGNIR